MTDLSNLKGFNMSPAELGPTLSQVQRYWPDRDLHVFSGGGFNAVRIFFTRTTMETPALLDLAHRCDLAGLRPILNLRDDSKDVELPIKFWTSLLRNKLPASTIIDPWNEPFQLDPKDWVATVQPALCVAIRKVDLNRVLVVHSGGYEGIAGYPAFVADPAIIAPSGPYVIGLHDYNMEGEGSDDYNFGKFSEWLDKKGQKALLTEFGGNDSMVWDDWVATAAAKARMHQKHGFGALVWMHKQISQNDTPGARVLRPDVLAALQLPSYAAPVRTDSTDRQPAGSVVWPVVGH